MAVVMTGAGGDGRRLRRTTPKLVRRKDGGTSTISTGTAFSMLTCVLLLLAVDLACRRDPVDVRTTVSRVRSDGGGAPASRAAASAPHDGANEPRYVAALDRHPDDLESALRRSLHSFCTFWPADFRGKFVDAAIESLELEKPRLVVTLDQASTDSAGRPASGFEGMKTEGEFSIEGRVWRFKVIAPSTALKLPKREGGYRDKRTWDTVVIVTIGIEMEGPEASFRLAALRITFRDGSVSYLHGGSAPSTSQRSSRPTPGAR